MDVVIYYCQRCHFEQPAKDIADTLEMELGLQSELESAFWGTFRIELHGREIYNRWRTRGWWGRLGFGHTPRPDEIVTLVRTLRQASRNGSMA